jgi:hypothetical protein
MPPASDRAPRRNRRRLLPLTVSIAVVAALLAFAGTAFAETKIGEGTSPEDLSLPGEADLLKATASYEVGTGAVTFEITTRAPQESTPEAERPLLNYFSGLASVPAASCNIPAFEAAALKAEEEETEAPIFPLLEVLSVNRQITAETTPPGVTVAQAYGHYTRSEKELLSPEGLVPGTKSLSGRTATVSVTLPEAGGDAGLQCAEVAVESATPDVILFPLTTKPEPPAVVTQTPAPQAAASQPPPQPAALSIAKSKKPLRLKVGKWAKVKVEVTNSGGTATAPGSLQLKGAKGVVVKGGKQKLPALLPGGSWTVSYKVKLTAKTKKTSTLSLVGAAGTVAAKSSLVLKLAGG